MRPRYVVYALILGAVIALLLWQGPEKVADIVVGVLMRTLSPREAKNRAELVPEVQTELDGLREELTNVHGIDTLIGQTIRTADYQQSRVDAGLSDTNQSWHLVRRAVDLYPIDPDTGVWDSKGKRDDLFRTMHDVAARRGWRGIAYSGPGGQGARKYLRSGAWDGGHLEFRGGFSTWAEAARAVGYIG